MTHVYERVWSTFSEYVSQELYVCNVHEEGPSYTALLVAHSRFGGIIP